MRVCFILHTVVLLLYLLVLSPLSGFWLAFRSLQGISWFRLIMLYDIYNGLHSVGLQYLLMNSWNSLIVWYIYSYCFLKRLSYSVTSNVFMYLSILNIDFSDNSFNIEKPLRFSISWCKNISYYRFNYIFAIILTKL